MLLKGEFGDEFVKARYANDVDDAFTKAIQMLHRNYSENRLFFNFFS